MLQLPSYTRFPAVIEPLALTPSGATNGLPLDRLDEESHDSAEGARAPASVDHLLPVRRCAFGAPALDAAATNLLAE